MDNIKIKCIKNRLCKHKIILLWCTVCSLENDSMYYDYIVENYKYNIKRKIIEKILNIEDKYIYEETLFSPSNKNFINNLKIAYKVRKINMLEGEISQMIIGDFIGWENLKTGHESGLDCYNKDRKIILELKNKYNTCNSDSLKSVLNKLSFYKSINKNTRCILGIINPKKNNKILKKSIIYNNEEIEIIQGRELMSLVFTLNDKDYSFNIIYYIKQIINDNL